MREFWVSSGHHLTHRTEGGGLAITDELLLAFLARPELTPPDDACNAERSLHAAVMSDPRRPISPAEIAGLADPDAQENWAVIMAFRDRLLAAPTVEAAYLGIVRGWTVDTPRLILNQLVHLILRNALDEADDPYVLRAAELFFRPQRVSIVDGATILADAEVIETAEGGAGRSPLHAMLGREPVSELDVLDDANAWTYWSRSDAFTMALNLSSNPKSRAALARAIERWVSHLLNLEIRVEPLTRIEDADWRWYVGLDAEATRIGDAVWNGQTPSPETMSRLLGLFRLDVLDQTRVSGRVGDRPIYLLLAMTAERRVTLKPQNLVLGLPLRLSAAA